MPASVVPIYIQQTTPARSLNHVRLRITALTVNANNAVPHGLLTTPAQIVIDPRSNFSFWEYQDADATNVYIGVGTGAGAAACDLYVIY